MKARIPGTLLTAALLLGATLASAASSDKAAVPQTDEQIAKSIRHEIVMYPNYSIWDDVNFRVENGQVELQGAVNQPFKKADLGRIVQKVAGVRSVANDLKVLPLSPNDDRLRLQVARAIYRDPVLSRYAMQAIPSIHIIVDNGHVTLRGVVSTDMEKQVAGLRASAAGLSFGQVNNDLKVENPSRKS
jgi:hyperosmotically inducible periplasmic protein